MRQEQLEEAISKKRDEMIRIGMTKGLHCEETVLCSQELDNMLNEYNRKYLNRDRHKSFNHYHPLLLSLHEYSFKLFVLSCNSYIRYFQF
ncbi:aspartyl-phosphate phosphatase Spo0E family protein [Neobacillus pocheonensis]|uniref:Spo0E family sporulation regulatory protein-aspartic acid phosphatase n=1 Tax=Neobacillus pocheonensis TaxID=363869 RepID=UPI003D29F67C